MTEPNARQREALREQLLNFLSLSSDIARNHDDAEFSDAGNQIIYCFDQTIFNLFFDTMRWRHAVSSFYQRRWEMPGDSRRDARDRWNRIQAQSALIASEYLLSDELKGAKNRNIYLTPWHRSELADRLQKISHEIEAGNIDRKKIAAEIRAKLDFLTDIQGFKEARDSGRFRADPVLDGDLVKLRSDMSDDAALQRYELTRRAATMLVECEASERLDQVHRLVSKPLRPRLKPLHQLFRPAEHELSALASDARKWHLRILHEARRSPHADRSERTTGGIWNDARSLAFVRWAAGKVRRDQRLVLITSDDTLFDAYRRWWCDEGVGEKGDVEPFVLRRSFQYTPIFNFRDAKNDLSRIEGMDEQLGRLFKQIAEAVHLTLLPFNLAQTSTAIGSLAHNRHFQYVALRGKDRREEQDDPVLDFYLSRFPAEFYESRNEEIAKITDLWREIERVGIGFFYDQVVKRLEDDRHLFGLDDASAGSPENVEQALRYLTRVLDTITSRTRLAYLPLAQSFLEQFEGSAPGPGRAPDLLWYQLKGRGSVYDLLRAWGNRKTRAASMQDLARLPEAPFVFAAVFALSQEDWWRADEFANYALEAYRAHGVTATRTLAELLFLNAFTKRFRLSSSGLADAARESASWEEIARSSLHRTDEIFDTAEAALEDYLACVSELKLEQEAKLYRIRGKSERAALRLAMALHAYFKERDAREGCATAPLEFVRQAQQDILEAIQLDKGVSATDLRSRQTKLRSHIIHTAVASEVCRFLIGADRPFEVDPLIAEVVGRLGKTAYSNIEEGDVLVGAERIIFQIIQGKADPHDWPELETRVSNLKQAGLTLDRLYGEEMTKRLEELFLYLTEKAASKPAP